jgi:hypothetical protein
MHVYLAGPMTGIPQFNVPAFDEAAADLRECGYEVTSPVEVDGPEARAAILASETGTHAELPDGESWSFYLARDFQILADDGIEMIVTLPGWEASRGARLEVLVGQELGIGRMDLAEALEGCGQLTHCPFCQNPIEIQVGAIDTTKIRVETEVVVEEGDLEALHDVYRVTDPKTGAIKADGGKPRTDLLPVGPLMDTAAVFAFGAKKYSDRNWELGFDWSRPYAALLRHLFAWWGGQDLDRETGLPHLAHAACCLMMLQEYASHSLAGNDDRPKEAI